MADATSNGVVSEPGTRISSTNEVYASAPNEGFSFPTLPLTAPTINSYVPQFSAAKTLILDRMRGASHGLPVARANAPVSFTDFNSDSFKDDKLSPAESLSSTLSLPMPRQTTSQNSATFSMAGLQATPLHQSTKRKRDSSDEAFDLTQNTLFFPMPTLLPSASAPSTMNVPDEDVEIKLEQTSDVFSKQRHTAIDRVRQKQLSILPPDVIPAKPELVGFGAGQASDFARTEYFYGKKRTDLLNILSFCDQLKPQLLVDILVSVSKKHPKLPMFDSPDWSTKVPSASVSKPRPTHQSAGGHKRPRHGHTIINPKARVRAPKVRGRRKIPPKAQPAVGEEAGAAGEQEDSLPPTWPKAGEGLYAKLPPEDQDRMFLADENDEEAFSHFMVDKFGKQLIVSACG